MHCDNCGKLDMWHRHLPDLCEACTIRNLRWWGLLCFLIGGGGGVLVTYFVRLT